jgi:hypothetical protein
MNYAETSFWRHILEDLAHGRCPYGLYIKKNYLCSFLRGKECSYFIDANKDTKQIYQEVISDILKDQIGLNSPEERYLEKERFLQYKSKMMDHRKDDWNNIRKKMVRDILLEQYVLQQASVYRLSIALCRKILCLLFIGLLLKTVQNKDIEYDSGFIHSISGFEFEDHRCIIRKDILCHNLENIEFIRTPFDGQLSENHDTNIYPKCLSGYWDNYLDNISESIIT